MLLISKNCKGPKILGVKRSGAKSSLLLHNVTCHPVEELKSDDGLIIATNIPPNCTALIQPFGQHYKKQLLTHLVG